MAFGNLALDLILAGKTGELVSLRDGCYGNVPIDAIVGERKTVDVDTHYNVERLRPKYETFAKQPLFIMTSEM